MHNFFYKYKVENYENEDNENTKSGDPNSKYAPILKRPCKFPLSPN